MFELLLGPIEQLRPEFVRMLTQQRRGRSWTCVTTRPGEGRTRHPELAEHFVGQRTPEATINNNPVAEDVGGGVDHAGRHTLALITEDDAGTRTVHTLNPNVKTRVEFNRTEATR